MKKPMKKIAKKAKKRMPSPQEIACWAIAYVALRDEPKPRQRHIATCYAKLRAVVHEARGAIDA